ncbi:hypothetical protein C0J52_06050, partial [Blattella germanica]
MWRSLYKTGALQALLQEIDKYNIDLIALQETRWIGNGFYDYKGHTVFYSMLEDAYNSAPENDVKLIMGDFNAKIGKEQIYMDTIGKHSLHEQTSENGERLIDFATSKNMIISSTCYIHPD